MTPSIETPPKEQLAKAIKVAEEDLKVSPEQQNVNQTTQALGEAQKQLEKAKVAKRLALLKNIDGDAAHITRKHEALGFLFGFSSSMLILLVALARLNAEQVFIATDPLEATAKILAVVVVGTASVAGPSFLGASIGHRIGFPKEQNFIREETARQRISLN